MALRKSLFRVVLIVGLTCQSQASWLSDITGIDINVPRGTINIGPPNPAAIPQMLQNLPKDAATFFLNPVGNALAFAIRHAKEQARFGCQPIPGNVAGSLQSFFPPQVMQSVCWNTYDPNRITLDNLLLGEFNQGAVTLEDVVVFQNQSLATDPVLWAHELVHVLQYRNMGVEAFAAIYSVNSQSMEAEAYKMQDFVKARLSNQQGQQFWAMGPQGLGQPITTQMYAQQARQALPPVQFCGALSHQIAPNGQPIAIAPNSCPIALRVLSVLAVDIRNGGQALIPCTSARCIIPPGGYTTFPDLDGVMRPMNLNVVYAADAPPLR